VEGTQPPPPPPNPGAASQTAAAPATVTTVTPSATNPQPKVGEVQVSGSKPAPTISTSQALSIINNEQSRVGNVEKSAVATATQQAATAASAAVTEAESVAGTLTTQSIAISMASSQTTTTTITTARSPSPQIQLNQGVTTFSVSPINSGSIRINELPSFAKQNETTSSISYSIAPPTFNMTDKSQQNEEFVFKQEGIRLQSNPIASHMNPLPVFPSNTNEQSSSSVKRNVQPNEAAGNVDIASMSIIPRGYDAYTSLALKDGSFYKPEEIYKNQKTVDNARVLRGLSGASDMKHQEMVNQQYQKGN
jgi:hypothetical protein